MAQVYGLRVIARLAACFGAAFSGMRALGQCRPNPSERRSSGLFWVVAVASLFAAAPVSGQCYTYTEIANPPGWGCIGQSINELGHVAGFTTNAGDFNRAFVWTPESGTRLLPLPPGVYDQEAYSINDFDEVVGTMNERHMPYVWDGQTFTMIEIPGWANWCSPVSINNRGQVVGTVGNTGTGPEHAFRWVAGEFVDLGPLLGPALTFAAGINESGQVAGYGGTDLWSDTRGYVLDGFDVTWLSHPPSLVTSRAVALSDTGFVVGIGTSAPVGSPQFSYRGIAWTPEEIYVVAAPSGTRDAFFTAVNDSGCAVGYFYRGADRPFIWRNGVVAELPRMVVPSPPQQLQYAWDINNSGQIIVQAASATGRTYSVVLNPSSTPGDLTGDCHVGLQDLLLLLSNFGFPSATPEQGDLDADGDVDLLDMTLLLARWGD